MYKGKKIFAVIAAAGSGKRMGDYPNKQYLEIGGIPVLARAIEAFDENSCIDGIIVAVKQEDIEYCRKHIIEKYGFSKVKAITFGGRERQDSVYNALTMKENNADYVLIHDGARPFVSRQVINRVVEAVFEHQAVTAGVPVKDTIKVAENAWAVNTPDRSMLYAVQTPQGFEKSMLVEAYEKALADGFYGTDDTVLVERLQRKVHIVEGDYNNIKITTKEDLKMGQAIAGNISEARGGKMRVGIGYDVHALVDGRPLILGGVDVPYEKGLMGHSDADVLIHAVMDGMLGACSLGDIGRHFPDTDVKYKGISSMELLEAVKKMTEEKGFLINNIDAVIIAQKPKLAPYTGRMAQNIAEVLGISINDVNIKATTTEKLGFEGRGEGIAAQAIVSVLQQDS